MSGSIVTAGQVNQAFLDRIGPEGHMDKTAAEGVTEYVRRKIRDTGILRRIMPMQQTTPSMFSRRVDSEFPVIVVDFEPDSPAAIQLSASGLPPARYMRAGKFEVRFVSYSTPRFQKNTRELLTYTMDIRQIFSDNAVKDVMSEEDRQFLLTVDTLLVGENSVVPDTGVPQWQTFSGGITRDTVPESLTILPKTPYSLYCETLLVNNVTVFQFLKWGRDETGGDMAERLYREGFKEITIFGVRLIITNKRALVEDNVAYQFAPAKFMGKMYLMDDMVLSLRRDYWMLEYWAYEMWGCTIANTAAVGKARFTA